MGAKSEKEQDKLEFKAIILKEKNQNNDSKIRGCPKIIVTRIKCLIVHKICTNNSFKRSHDSKKTSKTKGKKVLT